MSSPTPSILAFAGLIGLLLLETGAGAQSGASTGSEPAREERLRKNLRKLDRWNVLQLLRTEQDVDRRQKQRAAASSRPEELTELAEDEDGGVRFYVAVNPYTPLAVRQKLAADELGAVRAGVALALRYDAAAPAVTRQALIGAALGLAADTHPLVRLALASNAALPETVFVALSRDPDPVVRRKLADNPQLSRRTLALLARDSVETVRVHAVVHRNMPTEILRRLAGDPDPRIRTAVCRNPNTPVTVLDSLARDPAVEVRRAVAEHPATLAETLRVLAQDQDLRILVAVARHEHSDRETLLRLAADPRDLELRRAAQASLEPLLRSEIREDVLERWDVRGGER